MAGRPKTVSDAEIMRHFRESDAPFLFTTELAELINMSQQGAYNRLQELESAGYVKSKSMSQKSSRAWWLTPAGHEFLRDAVTED
jgi:DNA-binding IclR family transcriptional regulator